MTREGKYSWDLDINNMKVEELDALVTACNRCRKRAMIEALEERLSQFVADVQSIDCHLETPVAYGNARWVEINADSIFIKENPTTPLEV